MRKNEAYQSKSLSHSPQKDIYQAKLENFTRDEPFELQRMRNGQQSANRQTQNDLLNQIEANRKTRELQSALDKAAEQ